MDGGNLVTLTRRVYIGAPAEEVWPWLVEPERVEQYHLSLLKSRPEKPGDPVEYLGKLGYQPLVCGTVLELVETRRLVHTFQFQFADPDPESRVTYELVRYGEAMCGLEIRHEGLVPGTETERTVGHSWDVMLSSLKTIIETGKPLPWPSRRR